MSMYTYCIELLKSMYKTLGYVFVLVFPIVVFTKSTGFYQDNIIEYKISVIYLLLNSACHEASLQ